MRFVDVVMRFGGVEGLFGVGLRILERGGLDGVLGELIEVYEEVIKVEQTWSRCRS